MFGSHLKIFAGFVILFFCLALLVFPQNPTSQVLDTKADEPDKAKNLVVNVELVNVLFSVTDRKGKLVTDLTQKELKLLEDNRIQSITNFSRETDLPLTISLLIDTSTSIRDRFKFEQEAAIDFLYRTIRPRKDKALLITFDSAIELVQDYTDNPEVLAKAIRQVRPGGGTKMLDAIYLACQEKLKSETGRKLIILISDGDDNLSLETVNSTLEMAQRSDVAIFTISTNSSGFFGLTAPKADKLLKRLADETGGRAFFPFKAEDLSQSFQDIATELRSQYSLAYRSSNASRDGSFRAIKIEPERKNLRVKSRKGYYAPRG
ncbi:MAG: VWA domain-containing protein [Acidobacteria bacterium]|nr:VWA domain-containing protein [Acidobacteriota bacterium]MCI0626879.1 VWA domain-containing protein [Acidobacteriota bacterium]MCI0720234.1 VWA domain-containing protein [Acidobacteriota bacterium]